MARILNWGFCTLLLFSLFSGPCHGGGLRLLTIGVRAGVTGADVLGAETPGEFEAFDAAATFNLPWGLYSESGWGGRLRLMASAGALRGEGETALVVSVIPLLALGSRDDRFTFELGAGGALFSEHQFGTQDFGAPFQFALTMAVNVPLYQRLGVGYRFLHYSDAGIHGDHTIGADLHMIEFTCRF